MSEDNLPDWIRALISEFAQQLAPFEQEQTLPFCVFKDMRTGAWFCECHIQASSLVQFCTTDVPLDPNEQADYRANRDVVEDAYAFRIMKDDARKGRTFSNIVTEYTEDFDKEHPLKIIGGQHRFEALKDALSHGTNQYHGVKVYMGLTTDQRLDVQLISNTNIATSSDLFDRMQETYKGPQLRSWCQTVGLLADDSDFADRAGRGGAITVRLARTFIINYFKGTQVDAQKFDSTETSPVISVSGQHDRAWDDLRECESDLWTNVGLLRAGREFARLIKAQRSAFSGTKPKPPVDRPEKAVNAAILASWAYVAGILSLNEVRLKRHYALADAAGRDPLNAADLARAKHRTDPDTYRGLGFRTDPRERGRLVELFFVQAESGAGITKNLIDIAVAKYHAKQGILEVARLVSRNNP